MKAFSLPFDNLRILTTKYHYGEANLFMESNVLQFLCQSNLFVCWGLARGSDELDNKEIISF